MKRGLVTILLALGACGGSDAPTSADEIAAPAVPVARPEPTVRPSASALSRESMRYVAEAGEFVVSVPIDGKPRKVTLALDLVGIRVGDVPTLDYPVGFVKLDPLSLEGGDTAFDRLVIDTVLRTLGSPVQIFFDVHSVGAMRGRLVEAGATARGEVIGMLQIDDRQQTITFEATFTRPDTDRLVVDVPRVVVDAKDFALEERFARLAKLLGAKKIGPQLEVSGTFALTEFQGLQLPTFVRTPVTVNSVQEVRARLDAETEDDEAARIQLKRQGVPAPVADAIGKDWYDKTRRMVDQKAKKDQPVFGRD